MAQACRLRRSACYDDWPTLAWLFMILSLARCHALLAFLGPQLLHT
jgi:hypothetical protein